MSLDSPAPVDKHHSRGEYPMSSTSVVYTEADRLPDPITVDVVETAENAFRSADTSAVEYPTESVQHQHLRPEDNVADAKPLYPDLPPEHFFNRVAVYPVRKYTAPGRKLIQPGDVKDIIDRYRSGEVDPDTGRMRALNSCCICQGFGMDAFLRKMQSEPDVREYHACAQRVRAEMLADELVEDASKSDNDLLDFVDMHGNPQQRSNTAAVKRSELIVKTKAMVMGQLHREKYAPETLVKQQHLHLHGVPGGNPLEQPLAVADVDNLSIDDLLDRQRALRRLPVPA